MNHLQTLRELLHDPCEENWKAILELFENWEDGREVGLTYAQQHLRDWPYTLRKYPCDVYKGPPEEFLNSGWHFHKLASNIDRVMTHDQCRMIQQLDHIEAIGVNREGLLHSLQPFEHLSLKMLHLYRQPIADLSPLNQMEEMEHLSIASGQIHSVSQLIPLRNLKYLNLTRNPITDISLLKYLTNLETVILHQNDIEDLEPLAHLPKLKTLGILNSPADPAQLNYFSDVSVSYSPRR